MRRTSLVVALLAYAAWLGADHFPEDLLAPDPPDRQLAGIGVKANPEADLASAIKVFGPPMDYHEPHSETGPVRGGEAEYLWRRDGAEIKIGTMWHFDEQGRRVETVVACALSGSKSSLPLCSVRGVCLGDSLKIVQARYGPKFLRDTTAERDVIHYQFRDGTNLSFEANKSGAVTSIALIAAVE
jgi:hypothetical protein